MIKNSQLGSLCFGVFISRCSKLENHFKIQMKNLWGKSFADIWWILTWAPLSFFGKNNDVDSLADGIIKEWETYKI